METNQTVPIIITTDISRDRMLCQKLSFRKSIPLIDKKTPSVPLFLTYNNSRLELHINDQSDTATAPLYVDFLSGPSFYRYKTDRTINQPLAKAVGIKPGFRPDICDLTAGFGYDGFVFASMGCQVTLIERSAVVWALLNDGLERAKKYPNWNFSFLEDISLLHTDALTFLSTTRNQYNTIYMDPMYPDRKKSALNKLKMRLLKTIVGEDTDSHLTLAMARKHATKRVVVKRPSTACHIDQELPSFSVKSKKHRYDVYLTP